MLSEERRGLGIKPPRRDLLLVLLLLVGRRRVDVLTIFIVVNMGTNSDTRKANWAGIADEECTQFLLVRLPFVRIGELVDADVGGLGDFESFESWGCEVLRIGVRALGVLEAVDDFIEIRHAFLALVVEFNH